MGNCFSSEQIVTTFVVNLHQRENPDAALRDTLATILKKRPHFDCFNLNDSITRNAVRKGHLIIHSPPNQQGFYLKERCENGVNYYTIYKKNN